MILHQTHRTGSSNMRLLQHFGTFLVCLAVVSSQNQDTINLNEIENNSKNAEGDIISEKDTEKASSVVSFSIKEIKPKEQEHNLETSSSAAHKTVLSRMNSHTSAKFGQRSSKVKEEEKTEASHRGEQYLPNPKASHSGNIPEFQNDGRAQIAHRNVAAFERYPDSDRQEQNREGPISRHPLPNAKRAKYVEVRSFSEPAVPPSDSEDYDDSPELQHPNARLMPQPHSRQAKAENLDVSYDEIDDECSKAKSRSVSEEDGSGDRYPRQSSFRHRIQSTDGNPRHQEYVEVYNYRPHNTERARYSGANERTGEDDDFNNRQRKPYDRENHYYNRDPSEGRKKIKDLPPRPGPRHHDQHVRGRTPQGKDSSVSHHKDSFSKSLSVSKSYSDPKKTEKVVFYDNPNSNQRVPVVYQSTPAYVDDQLPYKEHRTHHQVNGPASQNLPPRENLRGIRHNSDNSARKSQTAHARGHTAHEHPESQQYDSSHPQTQYSNENNRDHNAPRPHHPPSMTDQQHPLPPIHHNPQSHAHHTRLQAKHSYVDHQVPTESQNQRQDLMHEPQQQYGQSAIHLQPSLRENSNQRVAHIHQNHNDRSSPYETDPRQARNAPPPNYNRDYTAYANNQNHDKEVVQTSKNAEPPKSLPHRDSPTSYYPIQDSGIRQHFPRSSPDGSLRLPETDGEPRPQVSVSYSESSYKDGQIDDRRYSPEKVSHYDEHERHPGYYKQELSPHGYAKTPVSDQLEKPDNEPNVSPEKSHGSRPQDQYAPKPKNYDDSYPASGYNANQNSDYGYQSVPPAEEHQHPRDDYESDSPEQEESPYGGVLPQSFFRNYPEISDKAKIIVAEPVPGKPGVLVADGARAIMAGNMRGGKTISHSTPTDPEYSESPQVKSSKPEAGNHEHDRNYGLTQNIPGSFAALVNTDPKFLRKLPEMMHSVSREPSNGAPDSGAYYSRPQEDTSTEEADGRNNYRSKNVKSRTHYTDLNNYGTAHGIIQDHGDGVRSMMYHIRPNKKKFSPSPEESRTSEQKQKLAGSLSKAKKSESVHYAERKTGVKIAE